MMHADTLLPVRMTFLVSSQHLANDYTGANDSSSRVTTPLVVGNMLEYFLDLMLTSQKGF